MHTQATASGLRRQVAQPTQLLEAVQRYPGNEWCDDKLCLQSTEVSLSAEQVVVCLYDHCATGEECVMVRTDAGDEGLLRQSDLVTVARPPFPENPMDNPVVRSFLLGTLCAESPASQLRKQYDLLADIFNRVYEYWGGLISSEVQSVYRMPTPKIAQIEFPPPTGITINMMPFVVGDIDSLPEEYRQYKPMLDACGPSTANGTIGYLTIQEGEVSAGHSQRRPGLHTDKSVLLAHGGTKAKNKYWTHRWGVRVVGGCAECVKNRWGM